ncbi:MAG TPA: peptidylprolyl isomerase [Pirellulales bacterium]|nr:peptidylprolyl isomerase [Pirellulales bacterium]
MISHFASAGGRRPSGCGFACILAFFSGPLFAARSAAAQPAPVVAARVGKDAIHVAEVEQLLAETPSGRRATPQLLPKLQAEALEQLINRRLVAEVIAKQGCEPTGDQVDELLADLKRRLTTQKLTFEEFLDKRSLTLAMVRRQLAWDAAWNLYLQLELNDAALETYFAEHRREFDGTELRVGHILLRVENLDDPAALAAAVKRAESLRQDILAKKLSFAEAAEKYSAGPSRRLGGDLGFIPRHDRMAEAFSRAAFQLKQGETSGPVTTPFGVHLIQCTEIKPGEQTWQNQRRALAEAWTRDRFLKLAEAARKQAALEYTGAAPYFDRQTHDLILPGPRK